MTYHALDGQLEQDRLYGSLDGAVYDQARHSVPYDNAETGNDRAILPGNQSPYGCSLFEGLYGAPMFNTPWSHGRPLTPDELLVRVIEGHRLLAELYEPPPLPYRGPGQYPDSFANRGDAP